MTNKTEAYKKVDLYRDEVMADRTPTKVECPIFSCVAYEFQQDNGTFASVVYRGKSKKTYSARAYRDIEDCKEFTKYTMNKLMKAAQEAKESRKRKPRTLEVGDVLVSSWGWEQTNIDYYIVTELVGSSKIKFREIGSNKNYERDMCGTCTPDPTNIIGGECEALVNGDSIKLTSYSRASKLEFEVIDGKRKYRQHHWSSYA